MSRDKETIYALLQERILPAIRADRLSPQEVTDLDGIFWGIAEVLCDENAPRSIYMNA